MDIFSQFNGLDYGVLVVLALLALVGLKRGFVRSLMTLVVWLVALLAGVIFAPMFKGMFAQMSAKPEVQVSLSFVVIIVVILIIGAVVNFFLKKAVKVTGLNPIDHMLGLVFGFIVGILLLTFLSYCVQLTPFAKGELWQESMLVPTFENMASVLGHRLPKVKPKTLKHEEDQVEPEHDEALN